MSGIQVAPDIEERHGFPGALRASPSPAVFAVGARATAAEAAARPGTSAARAESRATAAATARAEARAAEAAAGRPVAVGAGTTADRTRGPRAARAARRGLVHADHAPVERGAVERGDGLL